MRDDFLGRTKAAADALRAEGVPCLEHPLSMEVEVENERLTVEFIEDVGAHAVAEYLRLVARA